MANIPSPRVFPVVDLSGVQDPATKKALMTLSQAWSVRNNPDPENKAGFVSREELFKQSTIDEIARKVKMWINSH